MSNFNSVKKFMETFGQEVKNKAEFPDEKIQNLRVSLIEEELSELKEAIKNKDIKEVADALTDILYVTYGAEEFCKYKGGRLPTFKEWKLAAYTQFLDSDEFVKGKTYEYPSGDEPKNLNSQGILNYNKHVNVTLLPTGINGLVAMGGNVWEWINDQKNKESLTAGASWWYGPSKTKVDGAQYKESNFYTIYIGFRCVFDN